MQRDHILDDLNAATNLADGKEPSRIDTFENAGAALENSPLKCLLKRSLVIASLENVARHDTDPDIRAVCRSRYLDLTGKEMQP